MLEGLKDGEKLFAVAVVEEVAAEVETREDGVLLQKLAQLFGELWREQRGLRHGRDYWQRGRVPGAWC